MESYHAWQIFDVGSQATVAWSDLVDAYHTIYRKSFAYLLRLLAKKCPSSASKVCISHRALLTTVALALTLMTSAYVRTSFQARYTKTDKLMYKH